MQSSACIVVEACLRVSFAAGIRSLTMCWPLFDVYRCKICRAEVARVQVGNELCTEGKEKGRHCGWILAAKEKKKRYVCRLCAEDMSEA